MLLVTTDRYATCAPTFLALSGPQRQFDCRWRLFNFEQRDSRPEG